jgi:hypothetical protein
VLFRNACPEQEGTGLSRIAMLTPELLSDPTEVFHDLVD